MSEWDKSGDDKTEEPWEKNKKAEARGDDKVKDRKHSENVSLLASVDEVKRGQVDASKRLVFDVPFLEFFLGKSQMKNLQTILEHDENTESKNISPPNWIARRPFLARSQEQHVENPSAQPTR